MKKKTVKRSRHLINLLQQGRHGPRFILFLGAGASIESGVPTAKEMIKKWRSQYAAIHGISQEEIRHQPWYDKPGEYGELFELLYEHSPQRRDVIEDFLNESHPSWGYIYLVDLIKRGYFNAIFTTNFDDLLNEACYLYSKDVRPVVCAHDSSLTAFRRTTKRPKIFKLHGDFLFDSVKNTNTETKTLDSNMSVKLSEYSSEYGMVVLGYSGSDDSVMDSFEKDLTLEKSFPHGVYWCKLENEVLNERVEKLCENPKVTVIEISGFDDFFAECYQVLFDSPPQLFQEPFKLHHERLTDLLGGLKPSAIDNPEGTTPVQSRPLYSHIRRLQDTLEASPLPVGLKPIRLHEKTRSIFKILEADRALALELIKSDLDSGKPAGAIDAGRLRISSRPESDFAQRLVEIVIKREPDSNAVSAVTNLIVLLISLADYEGSLKLLDHYDATFKKAKRPDLADFAVLNRAQIYRHRGEELPPSLGSEVKRVMESPTEALSRVGAMIVLEDFEGVVNEFTTKLSRDSFAQVEKWPIFKLIPPAVVKRIRESIGQE